MACPSERSVFCNSHKEIFGKIQYIGTIRNEEREPLSHR
jgi:hypothetical protein